MDIVPPTLDTARLRLRAWREDDLAALAAYKLDAENWRYIADGQPKSAADVERILDGFKREWQLSGFGRWAVEERQSSALIGDCGFAFAKHPELAYMITRGFRGRGYATEAARTVLSWSFAAIGWPLVQASTHRDNVASRRVLAKLGFREFRLATIPESEVWYGIGRYEWRG